jgi:hypothetical protein
MLKNAAALTSGLLALLGNAFVAQNRVVWRSSEPASDADKASILQVAARSGIPSPASAEYQMSTMPIGCVGWLVKSPVVAEGHRVTWQKLWVWRVRDNLPLDISGCPIPGPETWREGEWIGASPVAEQKLAWRVRDGSWQVDVPVSDDIPYADVVRIVMAIRRGELVDKRAKTSEPLESLRSIDAGSITGVSRTPLEPMAYTVGLPSKRKDRSLLFVELVDGRIEVTEWVHLQV